MYSADEVVSQLSELARHRPVFHSEADFQQALAWQVHLARGDLRVRLETRPAPGVHLDMLIIDPSDGGRLAVELKYLTDKWVGDVGDESFALLRHGAQDVRGYDCVKDVGRLERVVTEGYAHQGLFLALSNDASYWNKPGHGRATNADAFRLYDGLVLSGQRAWGPRTGAGTMAGGRTVPVALRGTYALSWVDYAVISGARGRFRRLAVVVGP